MTIAETLKKVKAINERKGKNSGQRFVKDRKKNEYDKPLTENGKCIFCGADVVIHISKYKWHKRYHCYNCGCSVIEYK